MTHTPLLRRGLNNEPTRNACGLYCKIVSHLISPQRSGCSSNFQHKLPVPRISALAAGITPCTWLQEQARRPLLLEVPDPLLLASLVPQQRRPATRTTTTGAALRRPVPTSTAPASARSKCPAVLPVTQSVSCWLTCGASTTRRMVLQRGT